MLTLYHNGDEYPMQNTEYYIRELASGLDEIIFDISVWDPIYAMLAEEDNIVDRAGQRYLVKQIDAGAVTAKVVCQLDLDEWRAQMLVRYNSETKTVAQQLAAIKPTGWTVNDRSGVSIGRTIKGDYTPLEICFECTKVYSVYIRWDNKAKTATIYTKAMGSPVGAFATKELNLKEINYKGKSNNFATRLYAYGKDGLSFQGKTIHGSVYNYPYVDNNDYSSRVICAYWQDDRYTDVESLYDDAVQKLAALAVPERSYDCAIIDLQATNPDKYRNLDFSLFTVATLIDDTKNTTVDYQVVERHIWPYHPERNDIILDNSPLKITATVVQIQDEIENPNSTFQQIQAQRIAEATDWLLSGEGYVVAVQGQDGQWSEILIMDTNDMATATDVLRINNNGIGFSTNGVNGPYTNAWTIDGQLVADFITAGTLTANLIKAGTISDMAGKFSLNMETGALVMNDGVFKGTMDIGGTGSGEINVYDDNGELIFSVSKDGVDSISNFTNYKDIILSLTADAESILGTVLNNSVSWKKENENYLRGALYLGGIGEAKNGPGYCDNMLLMSDGGISMHAKRYNTTPLYTSNDNYGVHISADEAIWLTANESRRYGQYGDAALEIELHGGRLKIGDDYALNGTYGNIRYNNGIAVAYV